MLFLFRKYKPLPKQSTNGTVKSDNPLDALDYDHPAMKAGISSLAALLQIPPHHDHKEVLKVSIILRSS